MNSLAYEEYKFQNFTIELHFFIFFLIFLINFNYLSKNHFEKKAQKRPSKETFSSRHSKILHLDSVSKLERTVSPSNKLFRSQIFVS